MNQTSFHVLCFVLVAINYSAEAIQSCSDVILENYIKGQEDCDKKFPLGTNNTLYIFTIPPQPQIINRMLCRSKDGSNKTYAKGKGICAPVPLNPHQRIALRIDGNKDLQMREDNVEPQAPHFPPPPIYNSDGGNTDYEGSLGHQLDKEYQQERMGENGQGGQNGGMNGGQLGPNLKIEVEEMDPNLGNCLEVMISVQAYISELVHMCAENEDHPPEIKSKNYDEYIYCQMDGKEYTIKDIANAPNTGCTQIW